MSFALIRGICRQQQNISQNLAVFNKFKRYESSIPPPNPNNSNPKDELPKYSPERVKRKVEKFVFSRYFDYVKDYDKLLEKKFPTAMHVYRVFLIGVKELFNDMKKYIKVTKMVYTNGYDMKKLTRQELELYYQMPRDMKRVAPVLILSSLPFANYVIFPLAYMYPRLLLSPHFWSIQQKSEFHMLELKTRLKYNRRVFRMMQSKLHELKRMDDVHHEQFSHILGLIGSGVHPTAEELLQIQDVFKERPYHIDWLSGRHLSFLCHLHDLHPYGFKRYRLSEKAFIVHHMDLAIKREGGAHNMSIECLSNCCYLRGLNPSNLSVVEMTDFLNEWITISSEIDDSNISLYLHLPVLIMYNHPNNWILTH